VNEKRIGIYVIIEFMRTKSNGFAEKKLKKRILIIGKNGISESNKEDI
jgi:hypothetical protein